MHSLRAFKKSQNQTPFFGIYSRIASQAVIDK
jgi:hypothetical protein